MASTHPQNNPLQQTNIALWGPTGSGKDWLFRSFAKELEYYNRQDSDFHYELGELMPGEQNPTPLSPAEPPLNIPPTPFFDDLHYLFRRVALKQDAAHQNSARPHDIIIHNDKGANLVESLDDPITFESTFQTIIHAQNIFLVLGVPAETSSGFAEQLENALPQADEFGIVMDSLDNRRQAGDGGQYSLEAKSRDWTRSDYLKFMTRLLATLGQSPGHNLAVCMTKSDQLNFRGRDSWFILQRRYGIALRRLLEVHRQQHSIEVFDTSAAGYLRQSNKMVPNFQGGALRDTNRWNPINTAAPFFWIFEKIEREQIRTAPQHFNVFHILDNNIDYIPYPPPRHL